MKVDEYDNRSNGGYIGFYTKRGKVILNFERNVVSVFKRNKDWYNSQWTLLNEWKLKA